MGNAVSLNPETFLEGGGLIDDVDVVLEACRFEMFDYGGKADASPALAITMTGDDLPEGIKQYYSMGRASDWLPSDDGTQLMAVGSASAIRLSTNGGLFLKHLIDAGFPSDDLGDDISVLDGMQCHVIRIPAPSRNVNKTEAQKQREEKYGPPTLLVVSEIIAMPGEKKKPKGAPAKAAGKKAPAKKAAAKKEEANDAGCGDLEEKATNAVMQVLAEKGSILKTKLVTEVFKAVKDDPDRNEIVAVVFDKDDTFIPNGPWKFDGEKLSM